MLKQLSQQLKKRRPFLFGCVLVLLGLGFIYREAVFEGKILFPSNLLAAFYSPWSTHTFAGWGQGIPNKPIGGNDQVRLFYPWRSLSNQELRRGVLPQWNPYVFSGSPLLANFQSALFYPFNLLFLFLPQINAWSWLAILPFIIGFFGSYLYLQSLEIEEVASVFGAFTFSFCGFISVWTQENAVVAQSAVWLPWMLWGIELLLRLSKPLFAVLIAIFGACSILGGFFQVTFYIYVVVLFYGLFRIVQYKKDRIHNLFLFLLSLILSLSVSAIQILPSAEAFVLSSRGSVSIWYLFEQYLLPFSYLIHAFIPDVLGNPGTYSYFGKGFYQEKILYVGIVPLVFAVYAVWGKIKNPHVLFFPHDKNTHNTVVFQFANSDCLDLPAQPDIFYNQCGTSISCSFGNVYLFT